jgi:hypothetical protein
LTNKISLLGPNSGTTTKPGEQSFAETLRSLERLAPEGSKPDAIVFIDCKDIPNDIPGYMRVTE